MMKTSISDLFKWLCVDLAIAAALCFACDLPTESDPFSLCAFCTDSHAGVRYMALKDSPALADMDIDSIKISFECSGNVTFNEDDCFDGTRLPFFFQMERGKWHWHILETPLSVGSVCSFTAKLKRGFTLHLQVTNTCTVQDTGNPGCLKSEAENCSVSSIAPAVCSESWTANDNVCSCNCGDGFSRSEILQNHGLTCNNVNECELNPCEATDICEDSEGGYSCMPNMTSPYPTPQSTTEIPHPTPSDTTTTPYPTFRYMNASQYLPPRDTTTTQYPTPQNAITTPYPTPQDTSMTPFSSALQDNNGFPVQNHTSLTNTISLTPTNSPTTTATVWPGFVTEYNYTASDEGMELVIIVPIAACLSLLVLLILFTIATWIAFTRYSNQQAFKKVMKLWHNTDKFDPEYALPIKVDKLNVVHWSLESILTSLKHSDDYNKNAEDTAGESAQPTSESLHTEDSTVTSESLHTEDSTVTSESLHTEDNTVKQIIYPSITTGYIPSDHFTGESVTPPSTDTSILSSDLYNCEDVSCSTPINNTHDCGEVCFNTQDCVHFPTDSVAGHSVSVSDGEQNSSVSNPEQSQWSDCVNTGTGDLFDIQIATRSKNTRGYVSLQLPSWQKPVTVE